MNRKLIVLLLTLALGVAVVAGAYFSDDKQLAQGAAMAELDIGNMTCGSCVSKISAALENVAGIDQVKVSVTNGRGQMTYDPSLTSAAKIAEIVSAAGFPATVRLDMSASDYEKSMTENDQMSELYVARIGNRLISREEFSKILDLRGATGLAGDATPAANQRLRAQVWQELKEREILLAAADKNQVVVQDGEVDYEIAQMKSANKDFDATVVARFGSLQAFFNQLKESMIINRNIEENVVAGLANDRDKQQRFSEWYRETLRNTNVVIFDPALKQAETGGGSTCGGTCCGS
jgi:copper chaperone CopZ